MEDVQLCFTSPSNLVFDFYCKMSVGQVVMANYNLDEPDERGYWYDVKITKKVTNLESIFISCINQSNLRLEIGKALFDQKSHKDCTFAGMTCTVICINPSKSTNQTAKFNIMK